MTERKYRYKELGMLFDSYVGSGIAAILFVNTGEAICWTAVAISLVFGLVLGAACDRSQSSA